MKNLRGDRRRRAIRRGFTLLELLMVVIALAIIAALAIPRMTGAVDRGKGIEAMQQIAAIRGAAERFRLNNGSFTGMTLGNLDVTDPGTQPNRWFEYTMTVAGGGANYSVLAQLCTAKTSAATCGTDQAGATVTFDTALTPQLSGAGPFAGITGG